MINSHAQLNSMLRKAHLAGTIDSLGVHEDMEQRHGWLERITRRRMHRQWEGQQIRDLAEPHTGQHVYGHDDYTGPVVAVITWSRDCDHVCGESRSIIPATLKAYDDFRESQLDWAEGPMTFRMSAPSESFRSWSRDMVMEAHEDGHRHSVSDAYCE